MPAASQESILEGLTSEQAAAVKHMDGPLLVIAGAGSGKTRVLTRRVANLIAQGIPGEAILAITFTNKAAAEMRERVSKLLGHPLRDFGQLDQPWPLVCTFHSLGLRLLKKCPQASGLGSGFSVFDTDDQDRVIKALMKAMELSGEQFQPSAIRSTISGAKNLLLSAGQYAAMNTGFREKRIATVFGRYQEELAKQNAVDFDDLLIKPVEMFQKHADVLAECQKRWQYILIDEYQDTNQAQYRLSQLLAAGHQNLCVVGDPDQSIYAWRGANIRNILDFERDYPKARTVKLDRNYRSTGTIIGIANALIARNTQRKKKEMHPEKPQGAKAQLHVGLDERDEARFAADAILKFHEEGYAWSQIAVFYRINALSRVVEDALRVAKVPYRIARGVDFYHRREVKDALAYMSFLANPRDEISLVRIINTPARRISETTVDALRAIAEDRGIPMSEAMAFAREAPGLPAKAADAVEQFRLKTIAWRGLCPVAGQPGGGVAAVMRAVIRESGLESHYAKSGDADQAEVKNLGELITSAVEFDREHPEGLLEDYLADVRLRSDVDALKEGEGAVTLMTLHSAKGLEFPVVVMVGLDEGILPHSRVREHPDQLEEERRLCFVGITRAQERLVLTRAQTRTIWGQTQSVAGSQFLRELPGESIDSSESEPGVTRPGLTHRAPAAPPKPAPQREPENPHGIRVGFRVRHRLFGIGKVEDVTVEGGFTRVCVVFTSAGRKTLVQEYAKLEPLGF